MDGRRRLRGLKEALMPRSITSIVLVVGLALAGCSQMPSIYIFNNAGMELRVHTDRALGDDRWDEKIVAIQPGTGRTLRFGKVLTYPPGVMRVQAGNCEIAYDIPRTDWRHDFRYATLGVQVEPDLTMRQILPAPAEGEDPKAAAHPDFPLKPVSRVCS
jgi:hypothetical protein